MRVLSLIHVRQPSMSFIILADIPAASASFSCVRLNFSRYFLMFADRVFLSDFNCWLPVLSAIYAIMVNDRKMLLHPILSI